MNSRRFLTLAAVGGFALAGASFSNPARATDDTSFFCLAEFQSADEIQSRLMDTYLRTLGEYRTQVSNEEFARTLEKLLEKDLYRLPATVDGGTVSRFLADLGKAVRKNEFPGNTKIDASEWDAQIRKRLEELKLEGESVIREVARVEKETEKTRVPIRDLIGHKETGRIGGFDPKANRLVTTEFAGTSILWDTREGKELARTSVGLSGTTEFVSKDFNRVFYVHPFGYWRIWDVASGELHTLPVFPGVQTKFAVNEDRSVVVEVNANEVVKWDLITRKEIYRVNVPGKGDPVARSTGKVAPDALEVSPDFKTALIVTNRNSDVHLFDLEKAELKFTLKSSDISAEKTQTYSKAFPRENFEAVVISTTLPDSVAVWDLTDRTRGDLFEDSKGYAEFRFSPDGKRVFGIQKGIMAVWDARSGKQLTKITPPAGGSFEAVKGKFFLSPDFKTVLNIYGKSPALWDLETGEEIFSFKGHSANVSDLRVSPDFKRAVSVEGNGTLILWNLESKTMIGRRSGSHSINGRIKVDDDFTKAVTPSSDGSVSVWDLEFLMSAY